jgi:hypothetical protein
MSGKGHSRRFAACCATFAYPPKLTGKADILDRQFGAVPSLAPAGWMTWSEVTNTNMKKLGFSVSED